MSSKVCVVCHKADSLLFCSKCQLTAYCSRECQVLDWKVHKKTCGKVIPALTKTVLDMIISDDAIAL